MFAPRTLPKNRPRSAATPAGRAITSRPSKLETSSHPSSLLHRGASEAEIGAPFSIPLRLGGRGRIYR